jgi:hypothetical protein
MAELAELDRKIRVRGKELEADPKNTSRAAYLHILRNDETLEHMRLDRDIFVKLHHLPVPGISRWARTYEAVRERLASDGESRTALAPEDSATRCRDTERERIGDREPDPFYRRHLPRPAPSKVP